MASSEPTNIELALIYREEFDILKKQIYEIINLIKEYYKLA